MIKIVSWRREIYFSIAAVNIAIFIVLLRLKYIERTRLGKVFYLVPSGLPF